MPDPKIKLIFENNDFLVIDKPAGVLVYSVNPTLNEPSVVHWLRQNYPEIKNVGDEPEHRPGIVHRLDKETSGVMIIAKTQPAFEKLKHLFKTREIEKTYLALVLGKMPKEEGEIKLKIAKAPVSTKRTVKIRPGQKAVEATTLWRVLEIYSQPNGQVFSLLELKPKTGRTHQLRVHLSAIGHPIVGDYLYGGKTAKHYRPQLNRLFLHAQALEFQLERTRYLFEAPLPPELHHFLQTLKTN